jgi:hypothetical protein
MDKWRDDNALSRVLSRGENTGIRKRQRERERVFFFFFFFF